MEIRQVSADERSDIMYPLQSYAFEGTSDFAARLAANRARMPYFETVLNLVAEEGGEVVACAAAYPMRQNVRGKLLDMAGVASVATHPEHRRKGHVRALLTELLERSGAPVSVLWPFRPSFYAKFGYIGLPQHRRVQLDPAGLPRTDIPGRVERRTMREAFDDFDALVQRIHRQRHGFSIFDATRTAEFRDSDDWVAIARDVDGDAVGALAYRISGFGGELEGRDLLATGPLGRALLLQFLARHVDQVRTVSAKVGPDDVPELWGVDLPATTTTVVGHPDHAAPMGRVSDIDALDGLETGDAAVTVDVEGQVRRLAGGPLTVTAGDRPAATLTRAGFSGLVYGVLDPVDVVVRGLGAMDTRAQDALRTLFPPRRPQVFASF